MVEKNKASAFNPLITPCQPPRLTRLYNKEMLNPFGFGEYLNPRPLVAIDVHKEYGERVVLDKVSVSISPGDRIGFVGANGAGKTTLLRILTGEEIADSGSISRGGIRIGYLAQDFTVDGGKTVYEVATEGVTDLVEAAGEFERMSQDYKADDLNFVNKYNYLLNLLQTNNAFDLSDSVQTVLDHLDVGRDMDVKVLTLSSGQTMRLALARLLISRPDILVLDEPTNHLDLHANLWLREFLLGWQGGLLVVSHDRDFLNEVTTDTWELAEGNVQSYGGNYKFYKEQKGLQEAAREREVVRLSGKVRKAKRQIEKEKQRAAHSARKDLTRKPDDFDKVRAHYFKERAAKSAGRKKRLSEDKRDETAEQLEAVKRRASAKISPNLIESDTHKGKRLISARGVTCLYGDTVIIEDGDMNISFGDRIALFGNNGSGKSTWIKGMLGLNDVITEGEIQLAEDINVQFMDQRYAIVNRDQTVLENVQRVSPSTAQNDIRQHLAGFLFRETPEVDKKASILSGGETVRLALAMMAIQPVDLLVLDEPTNNLDIESIEQIETVLQEFNGAILVVSHDIGFLRNIGVDQSYVISDKELSKLMATPSEGECFKEELLEVL